MFSRVVKSSLGYCLSCVFLSEVICDWSWFFCCHDGSFRFRKIKEVFDLDIRSTSLLVFVVFIYKLPNWKVEKCS